MTQQDADQLAREMRNHDYNCMVVRKGGGWAVSAIECSTGAGYMVQTAEQWRQLRLQEATR